MKGDLIAERVAARALPGHDRDCALAILAQSRHRGNPLDDVQVWHLMVIGYTAGFETARKLCGDPVMTISGPFEDTITLRTAAATSPPRWLF